MTRQMHLLVIKETGHIVAAAAQTVAAGDPPVNALAGTDIPVKIRPLVGATGTAMTLVPADILEVKAVAFNPSVIADPQIHVVDGGRVAKIPALPALSATLKAATIDIPLATGDVPVVVVLASDTDPNAHRRAQSGKFDSSGNVTLAHAILPGDTPAAIPAGQSYLVMIACAGRRLQWSTHSI